MAFGCRSFGIALLSSALASSALVCSGLGVLACSGEGETGSTEDNLNYRSSEGQEYALATTTIFNVPANAQPLVGEARKAAIEKRADEIRTDVANAMRDELDRIWPEKQRHWKEGGLVIQLRQASPTFSDLIPLEGDSQYSVAVSAEFAGAINAAEKLPLKRDAQGSYLPVPFTVDGVATTLRVTITPIAASRNAYPKYLELFEGGLDISVHFGGDHYVPAKDVAHARWFYKELIRIGFTSPVATFNALRVDSPPLTRIAHVNGAEVPVRIRLFHVDMTTAANRELLVTAFKDSVKNADVIVYNGHSGRRLDFSGVVFAYTPERVSIPATQFKNLATTTKQQLYLFDGCETYTGYADKIYENPAKTAENTDVITAANFTAIQITPAQTSSFIHALIDEKSGVWIPRSWDSILTAMNNAGDRSWAHVYGVHGIDDDPKVSPLANLAKVGTACSLNADCGSADSLCVKASATRSVCGVACADSSGCPTGTRCALPPGAKSVDAFQCLAK